MWHLTLTLISMCVSVNSGYMSLIIVVIAFLCNVGYVGAYPIYAAKV